MTARPARLLAAALVCLAASGATLPARGAPVVPVWHEPVIVDDDPAHSAAEPSLSVAADGTIYLAAPTGLLGGNGDAAWRSDDGGETWNYLGSYGGRFGGGDADVVAGAGDRVFASGLYLACVSVAHSADRGETWTNVPVSCANSPIDDRQWNGVSKDGEVYTAFGSLSAGAIVVNRSVLSEPGVVPGPNVSVSDNDYQWVGVLAVDPTEGFVYVAWNTNGSPNDCDENNCDENNCDENNCDEPASSVQPDEIKVAVLSSSDFVDGVVTPPTPKLVASRSFDTFDAFVGVDVDSTGRAYVVWNERHPEVRETWTMLSSSGDNGETWTPPVRVNTTPTTAFPWVTAGDDGRIAVTYYGTDALGLSPEVVDGDWRVYSAYSSDGGKTFVETEVTSDPVHEGSVCTSGTDCDAGTRDLLDFFETGIDPDGCLVVTYTDNSRDEVVKGVRSANEPEFVAFVRQSAGPGLRAGKTCAVGETVVPAPSAGPPSAAPPAAAPRPRPAPSKLPATGLPAVLPFAGAVLIVGAATALRRRLESSPASS